MAALDAGRRSGRRRRRPTPSCDGTTSSSPRSKLPLQIGRIEGSHERFARGQQRREGRDRRCKSGREQRDSRARPRAGGRCGPARTSLLELQEGAKQPRANRFTPWRSSSACAAKPHRGHQQKSPSLTIKRVNRLQLTKGVAKSCKSAARGLRSCRYRCAEQVDAAALP